MFEINTIEMNQMRVLTTYQISELYGTTARIISNNFNNNKSKYIEGKHYIMLKDNGLQNFLQSYKIGVQNQSKIRHLYLWTEKGALLHAKSINTDKAWEVYEYLVDYYFRAEDTKRQQASEQKQEERGKLVVDAPENIKIIEAANKVKDDLICLRVLLDQCNKFISMEEYERRRQQALDAVNIIRADMLQFSILDPRTVRKVY